MREISEKLTDIDEKVHLVYLYNGRPKTESMSIVELAEWKEAQTTKHDPTYEIVGVFIDFVKAQTLQSELESGNAIFVPRETPEI